MPFLYGNHVVKAHIGKTTEDITEHQGVVVYSMNDIPLVRLLSLSFNSVPCLLGSHVLSLTSLESYRVLE